MALRKEQSLGEFIETMEQLTQRAKLKDDELSDEEQKQLFFLIEMFKKDRRFRAFASANTSIFAVAQRSVEDLIALLLMTADLFDTVVGGQASERGQANDQGKHANESGIF